MSEREYKTRLFGEFARIGSALASARRLEILDLLAQAPRHVEALAKELDMSVANTSQHLQTLSQARLVRAERQGTKVVYDLAGDSVLRLWLALRDTATARLADVGEVRRQFAVPNDSEPPISRDELERLMEQGGVVLLDVRPEVEYEHGHVAGARSVPLERLPEVLDELPRDQTIVAYCRGVYCLFADEAVALLREHGFNAVRVEGGWPEWHLEDRPADAPAGG